MWTLRLREVKKERKYVRCFIPDYEGQGVERREEEALGKFTSLSCIYSLNAFSIFKTLILERERKGERETSTCCSTYL